MDYEVIEYLKEVKMNCTGLTSCRDCKLSDSATGECLIKGFPHEWELPDTPAEIKAKDTIKQYCENRTSCDGCPLYSNRKMMCSLRGDFNPDQW